MMRKNTEIKLNFVLQLKLTFSAAVVIAGVFSPVKTFNTPGKKWFIEDPSCYYEETLTWNGLTIHCDCIGQDFFLAFCWYHCCFFSFFLFLLSSFSYPSSCPSFPSITLSICCHRNYNYKQSYEHFLYFVSSALLFLMNYFIHCYEFIRPSF